MALPLGCTVDEQIIVVAIDGSEQSEHAINWYVNHVHRPGNKVVFIHCIELPEMKPNQARHIHMSPGVLATMWKEEEQKTKLLEEKMKRILQPAGIPGVLRTSTGKPGEVICRVAEEEEATMIVTGARGMSKVRRTIMGSVSDYLVHHAHCPVVVCRLPKSRSRHGSGASSDGRRSRHGSGRSRHASGADSKQSSFDEDGHVRHTSGDVKPSSRHTSGETKPKSRHASVS